MVRAHEILGVTGLVGAGKTELARTMFGADKIEASKMYLQGKEVKISSSARETNKQEIVEYSMRVNN